LRQGISPAGKLAGLFLRKGEREMDLPSIIGGGVLLLLILDTAINVVRRMIR